MKITLHVDSADHVKCNNSLYIINTLAGNLTRAGMTCTCFRSAQGGPRYLAGEHDPPQTRPGRPDLEH